MTQVMIGPDVWAATGAMAGAVVSVVVVVIRLLGRLRVACTCHGACPADATGGGHVQHGRCL